MSSSADGKPVRWSRSKKNYGPYNKVIPSGKHLIFCTWAFPENSSWTSLIFFKKCTTWKLRVKFYWGRNWDLSPGNSISGSPEKPLQGGEGGARIYEFLQQRKVVGTKDLQKTRFTKNLQKTISMGRRGAYWNHFFDMLSWVPSGLTGPPLGVAVSTSDMTSFVLPTNHSPGNTAPKRKGGIPRYKSRRWRGTGMQPNTHFKVCCRYHEGDC